MREKLKVEKLMGKGRGVVASVSIRAGETIARDPVLYIEDSIVSAPRPDNLDSYLFRWPAEPARFVLALGYGSLFNHSFEPNVKFTKLIKDEAILFEALRDIAPGEEILIDYTQDGKADRELWFEPA